MELIVDMRALRRQMLRVLALLSAVAFAASAAAWMISYFVFPRLDYVFADSKLGVGVWWVISLNAGQVYVSRLQSCGAVRGIVRNGIGTRCP